MLESSRSRLKWLDRQIRMLRTVVWWYVSPFCLGALLLAWGLTGGSGLVFAFHVFWAIAIGTGIVYLNLWTVRRYLQPIRDDLSRLIEALDSSDAK